MKKGFFSLTLVCISLMFFNLNIVIADKIDSKEDLNYIHENEEDPGLNVDNELVDQDEKEDLEEDSQEESTADINKQKDSQDHDSLGSNNKENVNEDAVENESKDGDDNPSNLEDFETKSNMTQVTNEGPPYQDGDEGEGVTELKRKLTRLGIGNYPKNPSPQYGDSTVRNVKTFQRYYSLDETGIADQVTLDKINEVLSSKYQDGKRGGHVTELKKNLTRLGFGNYPQNPSQRYGGSTARNVSVFQTTYGLLINGIADEVTLAKIEELLGVIELKKNLTLLGIGNYPENPSPNYGGSTTRNVKIFQKYYGLDVTGNADSVTLDKIDEILSSEYQDGQSGVHVTVLKKNLTRLGFGNYPENPSQRYGGSTARNVSVFQTTYSLLINGIADEVTLAKIEELLGVIELKKNLTLLGIGNYPENPSPNYGGSTTRNVKTFQKYYGLDVTGNADLVTLDKIDEILSSEYQDGQSGAHVTVLKKNLKRLGFGNYPENPSQRYGGSTVRNVRELQEYYNLLVNGIADEKTLEKIGKILSSDYQAGKSSDNVVKLKKNLARLGFGNYPKNPSPRYGDSTAKNIKEFQTYFGLKVNGIADKRTLGKIEEILFSPYRNGQSGNHVVQLKKDLTKLGIGNYPKNPSPRYGNSTEGNVAEFQERFGLKVSGIADEVTLAKVQEALANRIVTHTPSNVTLNEALNIQMNQQQQTDKYRNEPAYVSAKHVDITQVEIAGSSVNLRKTPDFKKSPVTGVTRGTKATFIEEVKGANHDGSNIWYKIRYNKQELYVHSSLANLLGTATGNVNVRAGKGTSHHIYGKIIKGTTITILEHGSSWHQIRYGAWRNPTRADVEHYLNPNNNDEFQHLVLSTMAGATASELNKVLTEYAKDSILEGKGKAFKDGASRHNINEVYLVSHAFLETGRGKSDLAKGVEVGKNKSGNLVLVTSSNRRNLTAIKTTYNMFGIGAADSDPLRLGAIRAYKEGWFTPESAIIGGAKFVGDRYIHNKYQQNTLYKMRWNPASPGYPQYATDIMWATKQVDYYIKDIYEKYLKNPFIHLDIPQYK